MLRNSLVRRGTRPALIFFLSLPPSPEPGEMGEPTSAGASQPPPAWRGSSSTLASDSGGTDPCLPRTPPPLAAAVGPTPPSAGVAVRDDQSPRGEPPPPADAAAAAREWCSSGESGAREDRDDKAMRRRGEPGDAAIGGADVAVAMPGEPGMATEGVGGGGEEPRPEGGVAASTMGGGRQGSRAAPVEGATVCVGRETCAAESKHEQRATGGDSSTPRGGAGQATQTQWRAGCKRTESRWGKGQPRRSGLHRRRELAGRGPPQAEAGRTLARVRVPGGTHSAAVALSRSEGRAQPRRGGGRDRNPKGRGRRRGEGKDRRRKGGSGSGRSCGISLREDVRESETPPPFLSAAKPAETPPPEATKQGTATTLPARGPSNARCRRAAGARPARTPIPNPRVCAGAPFDPGCFSRPRPGAPTGLTHRDRCDEDPPRRGPPATGRGPQRGRFGIPPRHLGRCASCALKLPPRSMRERPPG